MLQVGVSIEPKVLACCICFWEYTTTEYFRQQPRADEGFDHPPTMFATSVIIKPEGRVLLHSVQNLSLDH